MLHRRHFLQWGLGIAAGVAVVGTEACSVPAGLEKVATGRAALGATDGPIYKKWIRMGGQAVVGAPTSDVLTTLDGAGSYETFDNGVIVYSNDWGAMLLTNAVFSEWLSLNGQTTPDGQNLLNYVGFPKEDTLTTSGVDTTHFERGMIVVDNGTPWVVYGDIYVQYFKTDPPLGLPTSAQSSAPGGGLKQSFEDGDVYWRSDTGAATVGGPILARWVAIGGAGGVLGYPMSDEQTVYRDGDSATLGTTQRFQNGVIYSGLSTGAWELTAPIQSYYEKTAGGAERPQRPRISHGSAGHDGDRRVQRLPERRHRQRDERREHGNVRVWQAAALH